MMNDRLLLEEKDNHNTIVPALLGIEPNIIKITQRL